MRKAIWILNDQCDEFNTALSSYKDGDVVLMAESFPELNLKFGHQKRTAFILAVNRQFATQLRNKHININYLEYEVHSHLNQIERLVQKTLELGYGEVILTRPKDMHQRSAIQSLPLSITYTRDNNLISDEEIELPVFKSKNIRMERFYQAMRQKTGLLMLDQSLISGQYNYDKQNKQSLKQLPNKHHRPSFKKTDLLNHVLALVKRDFKHQLGTLDAFYFSITREQALVELNYFAEFILPTFGQYQDNIVLEDAYLSHSLLSAYLNIGLLNPLEVCLRAEQTYHQGLASIETTEGFIRQILGWREYMFYQYLNQMPQLETSNALHAHNPLPAFYWTAKTEMNCLKNMIESTLKDAYANHIQRLMLGTNFALLAEIEPYQVHEWYLGVFADAWAWVEMPNTIGMGLYAEGGKIASKPYISSAAYIHRMSNACSSCTYKHSELLGEYACPFNALYWNHIAKHQALYLKNPRMAMMVRNYLKFDEVKKQDIALQAASIFDRMRTQVL